VSVTRRALVTGAGGFVGSHLAERLARAGYAVRAFVRYTSAGRHGWLDHLEPDVRTSLEIVAGDLREAETVRRAATGVDVVFHLGALVGIPYSYEHPREVIETNLLGTLNVLLAARDAGMVRVVHTSTSEVYGTARYTPMDERHPLCAQSPYAASKVAAEKLVESFHASYGLPTVVLRPFNVFGPRQSGRAVIPAIISQALSSPAIGLGNTATRRDFTFVTDTVEAFALAAETHAAIGATLNVGTGREHAIGGIVETVGRLIGRPDLTVLNDAARVRPEASEVSRLCADATEARRVLGWEPTVSFEDGLQATITWIDAHRDRFRAGTYET
jgi:NAD dependent epimerase/dehydratase